MTVVYVLALYSESFWKRCCISEFIQEVHNTGDEDGCHERDYWCEWVIRKCRESILLKRLWKERYSVPFLSFYQNFNLINGLRREGYPYRPTWLLVLRYIPTTILCISVKNLLKGQSNKIFCRWFFPDSAPPKPLTQNLKAFRIWLHIQGNICDFLLTLSYRLWRRVNTTSIIQYRELR
jgi:hypothetical protein